MRQRENVGGLLQPFGVNDFGPAAGCGTHGQDTAILVGLGAPLAPPDEKGEQTIC